MTSKECEEQLNSLIEHFNNGVLDFNATDIEAIKHLMLENAMQHNEINKLRRINEDAKDRLNALIAFWKKYNPINNTMQVEQFKGVISILEENDENRM